MFCAISGETPEVPVVSKKTGHVFEKRLIAKYIQATGQCPVTSQELSEDDLIPLQSTTQVVKPRPPTATSIPSLLSLFQSEWDAVMLETYQLKQQYAEVQQELSNTLYEHDAACRVIARLMKERDEARGALQNLEAQFANRKAAPAAAPGPEGEPMDIDPQEQEPSPIAISGDFPESASASITSKAEELAKPRRKRKAPASTASPETIGALTSTSTISLPTGATTCALDSTYTTLLTGGVDGSVSLSSLEKASTTFTSAKTHHHKGKVTAVAFVPGAADTFLSGGDTGVVKIWSVGSTGKGKVSGEIKGASPVTGLSVHPTGDYYVSSAKDGSWTFGGIQEAKTIFHVTNKAESPDSYTQAAFHPDGLILGTGTVDGIVRIWDLKSRQLAASCEGSLGAINSIAFSENGYHLATCSDGSAQVKLWDLRKLANFHTITCQGVAAGAARRVRYDFSSSYLGVAAGHGIEVYQHKTWNQLLALPDLHDEGGVTDLAFGKDSAFAVSVGLDGKAHILGALPA